MSAPRTWFLPDHTGGLTEADLNVLNRAVRLWLFGTTKAKPARADLMRARELYKRGMSAADLAAAMHDVEDER